MEIVTSIKEMFSLSEKLRRDGATIGFVPTMGALHEGHLSLLRRAAAECSLTVMSIFVNPTQFGKNEDFHKYPRMLEKDCELANKEGCSIVFAPSEEEMYPGDYLTFVNVEKITSVLCGAIRPGHFRGVATVVLKLINIVQPHVCIFGQKDAQQAIVIKRMVTDLNVPVRIIVSPTVRQSDGLAVSSRNSYLTDNELVDAPKIYQGIKNAEKLFEKGERSSKKLLETVNLVYERARYFKSEYIEIVDCVNLQRLEYISQNALLAVACRTLESNTRLIDNTVLGANDLI